MLKQGASVGGFGGRLRWNALLPFVLLLTYSVLKQMVYTLETSVPDLYIGYNTLPFCVYFLNEDCYHFNLKYLLSAFIWNTWSLADGAVWRNFRKRHPEEKRCR